MSWVEWKKIDIGIFTCTSYKFPWTCACLMWKNIIMLIHRQTYICIIMCFNKNTCNQKKWKHIFAHLGWVQKLLKTKELYRKHLSQTSPIKYFCYSALLHCTHMMLSSNGNIFLRWWLFVRGPPFTGWFPSQWLVTQSFDLHCACGCSVPTRAKPSTDTQLLTEIVFSRLSVSTVIW